MTKTITKMKKYKIIGLMKDEFSGKIIKEFAVSKAKTYSYLANNDNEDETFYYKNSKETRASANSI